VAPAAAVEVEPRTQAVADPFGLREVRAAVGEEPLFVGVQVREHPPRAGGSAPDSGILGPEELSLGHQ
jgi:hypothetical protein